MYIKGDPYWTSAKFDSICSKCGKEIKKGDNIFYYPKTKKVFCYDGCGQAALDDFNACCFDEEN